MFSLTNDISRSLSLRMMCCRLLCPFGHACSGKCARKWVKTWAFLAAQKDEEDGEDIVELEEEVLEVIKDSLVECIPERVMAQTVELAGSSGKAGSSGPGVKSTTSDPVTAVGKSIGEVWLLGTAKHSVSTESELSVSSGDAGSSGPG